MLCLCVIHTAACESGHYPETRVIYGTIQFCESARARLAEQLPYWEVILQERPAWAEIDKAWRERAMNWLASQEVETLVTIRLEAMAWIRNDVRRRYNRWSILDRLRPEYGTEVAWLDQEVSESRGMLGRNGFALLEYCDYSGFPPEKYSQLLANLHPDASTGFSNLIPGVRSGSSTKRTAAPCRRAEE